MPLTLPGSPSINGGSTLTAAPTLITSYVYNKRDDLDLSEMHLPTLTDEDSYSTPSMEVPKQSANPYILRDSSPNGTVFIAVGAIVGAILMSFILFHLINSLTASRLAKKALFNDKQMYEKYQNNNNTAYGISPSTTNTLLDFNHGRSQSTQSIAKLPLLSHHPSKSVTGLGGGLSGFNGSESQLGDTSTLYQSEAGGMASTSKHDLTKMFISPTAEVMTHNRVRSGQFGGSMADLSFSGSHTNLSNSIADSNHQSGVIPNLYMNNTINNSDYNINANQTPNHTPQQSQSHSHLRNDSQSPQGSDSIPAPDHLKHLNMNSGTRYSLNAKPNRRTIPSMYLEDLIDE